MADNKQAGAAVGSGPTFATDEIAGVDYPRSKIVWGVDGVATDASASNPLPVVQTGTPALPTGAATEATLLAASAKLPATLGQKVMTASMAVVIASDQGNLGINDGGTSLTMDSPQLPAALVSGRLSVDGSAVTQPVSAASLPLPSGAATEATLAAASAKLPSALGQTTMAASLSVAIASNQGALPINDNGGSLTIDAASLPLPTGASTAAKQPALGTAGTPSADVITVQGVASMTALKVDGSAVTQPVSLASVPSHAVTNAGTFATQESGAALTALQLIDNIVAVEDAVAGSGDSGVPVLAVRRDAASSGVSADGDYANLSVDSTGALRVTGGGGGTQYTEDSAHASGDTGTLSLAVRRDANTTFVSTDGDYSPLAVDASGNLKVAIISGAGSGGTAMTDDSAFTPASSSVTPMGAVFDDTTPDSVDEGDIGAPRMSANRNLYNTIRDAAGNERGANVTAGNALQVDGSSVTQPISGTVTANAGSGTMAVSLASVPSHAVTNAGTFATQVDGAALTALQLIDNLVLAEDAAHASADPGVQMLAVRKDTAAALAGTDGDYAPLEVDASGRLHVNVGALPASTNTIEVVGDAAHDAAIAGNPVRIAGRAATSDYTAVASGDTADLLTTILGKQVVQLHSIPDNTWEYAAAAGGLVSTAEVTAKAAGGAGIRHYVSAIQVINSHATVSTEVVVRDGTAGTVKHRGWAQAAGGGYALTFNPPLRFSANTLVSIGEVTATTTTGVLVNLQGYSGAE